MDRLFDPDAFRSAMDSGREPRVPRRGRTYGVLPGVEVPGEGWFVITDVEGPIPGVHRITETLADGSVITPCNHIGRMLAPVTPGSYAYLCDDGCLP